MKRFNELLNDFIDNFKNKLDQDNNPVDNNPLFILIQNWQQLIQTITDPILAKCLQESNVDTIENKTLTIFTKNANARFILNMNSTEIIDNTNKFIQSVIQTESNNNNMLKNLTKNHINKLKIKQHIIYQ